MLLLYSIRQNGSSEHERATAVAVAEDGSIVVGGFRSPGTYVAVKLDAEGNFVWQWEVSRFD